VAVFGFVFSMLYTPTDALMLFGVLTGAIYAGGAGAVVIGGLYWKRGTTQGAWTAMIISMVLALASRVLLDGWKYIHPHLVQWAGPGAIGDYLALHPNACPINGQWMTFGIILLCGLAYIVVSLLTHEQGFEMDRMLHRGKYAIEQMAEPNQAAQKRRFTLGRLFGIDEHYTLGDKFIAVGILTWEFGSNLIGLVIVLWNLFLWPWTDWGWLMWQGIRGVLLIPLIGFIVVFWLSIGAIRDMVRLIRQLKTVTCNDADDGMVRDHHNLGEPNRANKNAP
jgi:SSS family solute:Na+ symporter